MSEKEIKGQKKIGGDRKDSYEDRNVSDESRKRNRERETQRKGKMATRTMKAIYSRHRMRH